jgi:putative ABC transport system permease protein
VGALRWLLARSRALLAGRRDGVSPGTGEGGSHLLDELRQDTRFALRHLGRHPGFAAALVALLTFGIGVSLAAFAIVDSMLLRPLPYRDAGRLVVVDDVYQGRTGGVGQEEYREWTRDATLLESFALVEYAALVVPGDAETDAERLEGNRVTAGFFRALGARPLLGRTFLPDEDQPGKADVIVLSHALWQRRFGGDRGAVGRKVQLGERSYTVVGVMPSSFFWVDSKDASFWVPLGYVATGRPQHQYTAVARLRSGVSLAAAQAQMNVLAARAEEQFPEARGWGILVRPLRQAATRHVQPALLALTTAVGLVLLLACANVAGLILVRMDARLLEIGMRAALGAGRRRLVRQILVEGGVVAVAGGTAGLVLAHALLRGLLSAVPRNLQPPGPCDALDPRVLLFSLPLVVGTTLLFSLAPIRRVATFDLVSMLKAEGASGYRPRRLLGNITVGAVALATVLLVSAGLLIGSQTRLASRNLGFRAEHLLTLEIRLPGARYPASQAPAVFRDLLGRVRAVPGVESAAATSALPLSGQFSGGGFDIDGRPTPEEWRLQSAQACTVTPGYFQTMGIRLLRGRDVTGEDREAAPAVAVISDTMARRHWPGLDPIGSRIRWQDGVWRTVVGVVADTRYGGPRQEPESTIYVPHAQAPSRSMFVAVRLTIEPAVVARAIRRTLREMDAAIPVTRLALMEQRVATALSYARFLAATLGGFALVALGLAATGLYGVIAQSVARRKREIGVRGALGATRERVVGMVVRQGLALTAVGLAVGLVLAVVAARSLSALLVDTRPLDPLVFTVAPSLLAATALLATFVPARHAATVDPVRALRAE